jgi:hypothetical protein
MSMGWVRHDGQEKEERKRKMTEAEGSERSSTKEEVQGVDGSGEGARRDEKGNAEADTETKVAGNPAATKPVAVLKKNKPIVAVRRRPDGSAPPATKRVKQDDGVCPCVTMSVPRVRVSTR